MIRLQTAVILSLAFISYNSHHALADGAAAQPGYGQAIRSELGVISSLRDGNIQAIAQKALDILVSKGATALRAAGYADLAGQYEQSWKTDPGLRGSLAPPTGLGIMDLGDHTPLSKWLANFHDTLASKSPIVKQIQLLNDIDTMNYALAVAIDPRGVHNHWKNGDDRDYIEYRKHFIPFVNIVEYWTAYEGCESVASSVDTSGMVSYLCDPAATKLTAYLARKVNWKLSDWIYWKANGHASMTTQGDFDALRVTERELDVVLNQTE